MSEWSTPESSRSLMHQLIYRVWEKYLPRMLSQVAQSIILTGRNCFLFLRLDNDPLGAALIEHIILLRENKEWRKCENFQQKVRQEQYQMVIQQRHISSAFPACISILITKHVLTLTKMTT